ncbi:flocculation protein FLO11-like isoform X2 [Zootermopsis nevadensis]|uniref:flocculation protein FLO11-like isoform X2 n=1 Tax=Zootermopsis nevadensis TaxID=136037 RepID=UPI000B8EBBA3|nr:flocculation protein FLO11-like isoform X2 [Zootermopsis nevadensis]
MRRISPQNKGEKYSSPRVNLRLHQIKARDEKRSIKVAAAGDVASSNNKWVEVGDSMEGKAAGGEDVYEFKSGKETSSVRGTSASPDAEKKEGHVITSDGKEPCTSPGRQESPTDQSSKRSFSEANLTGEDADEESKRKKRKDSDSGKENSRNGSGVSGRFGGGRNGSSTEKCSKVTCNPKNGSSSATKTVHGSGNGNSDRRSPSSTGGSAGSSPKLANASASCGGNSSKSVPGLAPESDGETDDGRGGKCSGSGNPEPVGSLTSPSPTWTAGPKVPPLKIVIPQQSASMEQEQGNRNGKNGTTRHHQALPYVVPSSNSADSVPDKEASGTAGSASTSVSGQSPSELGSNNNSVKNDEKKDSVSGPLLSEDQRSTHHQRVLRSSHRSGGGTSSSSCSTGSVTAVSSSNTISTSSITVSGTPAPSPAAPGLNSSSTVDRGSNNSSPNQSNSQRQSPSPAEPVVPITSSEVTTTTSITKSVPSAIAPTTSAPEEKITESSEQQSQSAQSTPPQPPPVDLHPRKRKMKQSKESQAATASTSTSEPSDSTSTTTEVHPHDQPIMNCYQLFLNIRKQIERRRKGLFPVQPKPPQGFKDYLMNRCTYVLAGNASSRMSVPIVSPPQNLQGAMKDLFIEQEKERYRLRMQHVIEKEKLVLSVEQEILRVHGRAARALANQSLPFSVCTILKDEEVYNVITPEQEEKDRNARSRYNGRLFLSWLQDVDDKWEKIKESMLLRHHNEAESLHAVQRMDWEWKMKELGICEFKAKPVIEDLHVPMVHVSDDFDLLPA